MFSKFFKSSQSVAGESNVQGTLQAFSAYPGTTRYFICIMLHTNEFIHVLGTGKSVTGARIAYAFAMVNRQLNTPEVHQCVLYCGPSNKSVDVVFGEHYTDKSYIWREFSLAFAQLYPIGGHTVKSECYFNQKILLF